MPRKGLSTERVVEAAALMADAEGLENLILHKLAKELGVRPSSLFNHIAGLPDLRRQLQIRGLREMAAKVGRACVGRAGDDAVIAAANAAREYAHEHPGVYLTTQPAVQSENNPELEEAASQFVGIFFDIMRYYGFEGIERVHAVRGLFATIHGFIMLEQAGHFGMPIGIDESYDWIIEHYVAALNATRRDNAGQNQQAK
ncbi:MAG: TetR-like C-terminal domain-containing protein [Nitrolancea sp.]